MKKKHKILMALLVAVLSVTAITGIALQDPVSMEADASSKSVKLSTKSKTIAKGMSFNLSIKNTGGKKVKWSTTKKSVASIKKVNKTKYKVTAKKKGTATIKAKVNGKTYKCKVKVIDPKISKTSKSLTVGSSFNLSVSGSNGSTIKWSTSDKSIASIKKVSKTKYKVTAKKKGTVTIKAKVAGKTLKCKVTVNKASSSSSSGSSDSGSSSSSGSSSTCSHSKWVAIGRSADGGEPAETLVGSLNVCNVCEWATEDDTEGKIAIHCSAEQCGYHQANLYDVRYECAYCDIYYIEESIYYSQSGEIAYKYIADSCPDGEYTPSYDHYKEYWASH